MKNNLLLIFLVLQGMLLYQRSYSQMIEGRIHKYYLVIGSYNTMSYANKYIKQKEKDAKAILFVLSIPNKKIYRVCYSQSKTKEEIMSMKEQAVGSFPEAWILYLD